MKKFVVETYYTCTFKTVHTLNDLNEKELSKIDDRNDGKVEVIDVKLNNRKTKKIGEENIDKSESIKFQNLFQKILLTKSKIIKIHLETTIILKLKIKLASKCQIEEKVIFRRLK